MFSIYSCLFFIQAIKYCGNLNFESLRLDVNNPGENFYCDNFNYESLQFDVNNPGENF